MNSSWDRRIEHLRSLAKGLTAAAVIGSAAPVAGAPSAGKSTLVEASWAAYQAGDYQSAVRGFKLLARKGVVKAQTNLGYMYALGKGVAIDLKESAYWLRMAAERGHSGAQTTLGLYYYNGEGLSRDIVAAHAWFSIAAASGHPQADDYERLCAEKMTPAELDAAHTLAKRLYARFGEKRNLW